MRPISICSVNLSRKLNATGVKGVFSFPFLMQHPPPIITPTAARVRVNEEEDQKKRAGVVMIVEDITAEKTMLDADGPSTREGGDGGTHTWASGNRRNLSQAGLCPFRSATDLKQFVFLKNSGIYYMFA